MQDEPQYESRQQTVTLGKKGAALAPPIFSLLLKRLGARAGRPQSCVYFVTYVFTIFYRGMREETPVVGFFRRSTCCTSLSFTYRHSCSRMYAASAYIGCPFSRVLS